MSGFISSPSENKTTTDLTLMTEGYSEEEITEAINKMGEYLLRIGENKKIAILKK